MKKVFVVPCLIATLLPVSLKSYGFQDLLGNGPIQQITTTLFGVATMYTFGEVLYRRVQKLQKHNDPNKPDVQEFLEGLTLDFADQAGLITQENLEQKIDEIIAKNYPHIVNQRALRAVVVQIIKEEFEVSRSERKVDPERPRITIR